MKKLQVVLECEYKMNEKNMQKIYTTRIGTTDLYLKDDQEPVEYKKGLYTCYNLNLADLNSDLQSIQTVNTKTHTVQFKLTCKGFSIPGNLTSYQMKSATTSASSKKEPMSSESQPANLSYQHKMDHKSISKFKK